MLQCGHGRLILMSSQKAVDNNNRDVIDIGLLRSSHITSNHVVYSCPPHMKEMAYYGILANVCICYLFSRAFHIIGSGAFYVITDLLSKQNSKNEETENTNYGLVTELGFDINLINDDLQDMSTKNLCLQKAFVHLQTHAVSLKTLIKGNNPNILVSDTVMIYIDPAPILSETSLNAICFTTRLTHFVSNTICHKYIIIAIENFKSDQFDKETHNYQIATANILMDNISDIFEAYWGHFKRFVIAPEADSLPMEQFWVQCQHLYAKNSKIHSKGGPRIFFTTIKKTLSKESRQQLFAEKYEDVDHELMVSDNSRKSCKRKFPNYLNNANNDEIDVCSSSKMPLNCVEYRVGYNLGHDKTKLYLDFILKEYNMLNVSCSAEIFSKTLCSQNISIPTFIAENLNVLTLKSKGTASKRWQISGKSRKNGEFLKDDVADSVIMSISLFKMAVGEDSMSTTLLYELKPEINNRGYLQKLQKLECVITTTATE